MMIAQVGLWLLLVLGVAAITVGLWRVLKYGEAAKMIPVFLIGVLLVGLGIWQLAFVGPFTRIADAILRRPGTESYGQALDAIAQGKVDASESSQLLESIVTQPVPGTDSLLASAEARATQPAIRSSIQRARSRLESDKLRAAVVADSLYRRDELDERAVAALPTTTRILVGEHVARAPLAFSRLHADSLRSIARAARVMSR